MTGWQGLLECSPDSSSIPTHQRQHRSHPELAAVLRHPLGSFCASKAEIKQVK